MSCGVICLNAAVYARLVWRGNINASDYYAGGPARSTIQMRAFVAVYRTSFTSRNEIRLTRNRIRESAYPPLVVNAAFMQNVDE